MVFFIVAEEEADDIDFSLSGSMDQWFLGSLMEPRVPEVLALSAWWRDKGLPRFSVGT